MNNSQDFVNDEIELEIPKEKAIFEWLLSEKALSLNFIIGFAVVVLGISLVTYVLMAAFYGQQEARIFRTTVLSISFKAKILER